ncbi:Phage integrase domain containing protein, partial [Asbolus verrucosus]
EHHKPKKSDVLNDTHIAPDRFYLIMKVALTLGISYALRCEKLCKTEPADIEFRNDVVIVTIAETKTGIPRSFAITDPQWIDKLKKYNNLRKTNNQRFFLTYVNGKYINTPVAINTIGKISMKIAEFLKLVEPWTFTCHSFRRSSTTLLANHGEGLVGIKQFGG